MAIFRAHSAALCLHRICSELLQVTRCLPGGITAREWRGAACPAHESASAVCGNCAHVGGARGSACAVPMLLHCIARQRGFSSEVAVSEQESSGGKTREVPELFLRRCVIKWLTIASAALLWLFLSHFIVGVVHIATSAGRCRLSWLLHFWIWVRGICANRCPHSRRGLAEYETWFVISERGARAFLL